MALTKAQAQCLAGVRGDVVTFYAGYGWSRNDPDVIFADWWVKNIASRIATGDDALNYTSLEAYAAAKGCGISTASTGGSAPAPVATQPAGPTGVHTGGEVFASGGVTQTLIDYMKREPFITVVALAFAALTARRLYRSE